MGILRNIFLLIVIVGAAYSCKQAKSNKYTIEGKISSLSDSTIILVRNFGDSILMDTIISDAQGRFFIEKTADTLTFASLYFNEGRQVADFFVNKGFNIKIQSDQADSSLVNISGGQENNHLSEFQKQNKTKLLEQIDLQKKLDEVKYGHVKANVSDLISRLNNVNIQLTEAAADYIRSYPDRIVSVILLNTYFKNENSVSRLEKKLQLLREPASEFPLYFRLKAYVDQIKTSQEGAFAPPFREKDEDGKEYDLYAFRGRYLLLSFVSNECPLCLKNREEQEQLRKDFQVLNNLELLTFMIDEKRIPPDYKEDKDMDSVANLYPMRSIPRGEKVNWKVIILKEAWASPILANYNINDLPMNILISPEGKILIRSTDVSQVRKVLDDTVNN